MDQDVVRPHFTSNAHFSAVFWDTHRPDLSPPGAYPDIALHCDMDPEMEKRVRP